MGLFDRATVKAHGVTVNVEVNADAKSVDPPKPELVLLPFDRAAYDKAEVAKQASAYAKYSAKRGCVKCGAPGSGFPHKSVYRTGYTVWESEIEKENSSRSRKFCGPFCWSMSPGYRVVEGPGYIARQCVRCNYEWNELACDEKAAV